MTMFHTLYSANDNYSASLVINNHVPQVMIDRKEINMISSLPIERKIDEPGSHSAASLGFLVISRRLQYKR